MSDTWDDLDAGAKWGAGADDQRPADPSFDGVGSALAAELVAGEGLRGLSRESGVPRTAIRRLIAGDGCSLRNLAALTEARPALVVYVEGVAYRLQRATDVGLSPDLSESLNRDAAAGHSTLGVRREVVQRQAAKCSDCGAEMPPGASAWVQTWREPGSGLQISRQCAWCAGRMRGTNPDAGEWADTRLGTSRTYRRS